MNVSGYKVVSCCDPALLGQFVGTALEQGWVLYGNPFTLVEQVCQAVVKTYIHPDDFHD